MIRVLLIDDDIAFAEKCIATLLENHFDVRYCTGAEEARRILNEDRFDIAVIDLMLPPNFSTEGLSLLRMVRQDFPVILPLMITAKGAGTTEIVAEAMRLGAQHFLYKDSGVFFERLKTTMRELVRVMRQHIFISHGHSELLKLRLKDFLTNRLKLSPIVLSEQPSQGLTVVEKLERISEKCCFAIVLMTKDDELKDGDFRARQNVVHELGFFQGKYGRKNVVLLTERGVETFSNISGIIRLEFEADHFEEVFEPLRIEMTDAFPQV